MKKPEHKLIGSSNAFLNALEHVSHTTGLNRPVLIVGERGTGKELVAERVHFLSDRWDKPLIKLNCAAISDALLESELFGHEAGAFTGATKRHIGRFERAHGGTLFLDELATMSLRTQEKVLRLVEYGELERLGGQSSFKVDVRLVAATNEDLPSLANQGKFRHDLLDRLAFDVITLPPLRERHEDIQELAEHFALSMCKELGFSFFPGFTDHALHTLISHTWPGNVRELKNVVERSVYRNLMEGIPLDEIILDPFASPFRPTSPSFENVFALGHPEKQFPSEKQIFSEKHITAEKPSPKSSDVIQVAESKTENNDNLKAIAQSKSPEFPIDLKSTMKNQEMDWIKKALHQAKYNQKHAATLLGLTYHQLRAYLRKHKINENSEH